jgi:plastocyanin
MQDMIVRLGVIAAVAAMAGAFAFAPSGNAGAKTALLAPQDLEIRAGEHDSFYYYTPSDVAARPGAIRVTFINEGARQHTFNVKQRDEWRDLYNFPLVQPGDSAVFEFELLEPGAYVFYCQLYKHVDHGQTGVIQVAES